MTGLAPRFLAVLIALVLMVAQAHPLDAQERVLRALVPVLPALAVLVLALGGAVFLLGCGGSDAGLVEAPLAAGSPAPDSGGAHGASATPPPQTPVRHSPRSTNHASPTASTPAVSNPATSTPAASTPATPTPTASTPATPTPTASTPATPTPTASTPATPTPAASAQPSASPTLASTAPQPKATPATPATASRPPSGALSTLEEPPPEKIAAVDAAGTPTAGSGQAPGSSPTAGKQARGDESEPGLLYTWRDGDHTRRAWLRTDLVLQPTTENTADDAVVRGGARESIVERRERHATSKTQPVFVSQSGTLMTLPGGVVLVLLEAWDEARIDGFFADHGIDRSRAVEQGFAANAYLIETEPGLASLVLANALADQEGVRIAVPNWSQEVVLR